ncbi:MAG TPA: RagB/SusD family nutrient uptake outer membrane protein [Prolixibacteraceae bacterium]|nr:RagB/SusD family nutrient uptake outer membrane protein [Prolixibacteraceae bacterium]
MKKILFISTVLILTLIYSCKDSFMQTVPLGMASDNMFYSEKGVNSLLTGAYSMIDGAWQTDGASWAASVDNWVWGGVASDDAYKGTSYGDQPPINSIEIYQAISTNDYVANRWHLLYDGIARTNDCLKALKVAIDNKNIEAAPAAEIEAEAKFLRAWFHFEQKRVFNNIPYITETADPATVTNTVDAWPLIEADLKAAVSVLPESQTEVGRPTKYAAEAVLARVYLFQQKWTDAQPLLDDIINSGKYSLMPNYSDNYMIAQRNNKESIFEIQYSVNDGADGSSNAGWGSSLNFPQGGPFGTCCGFYQPSQNLVNAFKVDANGLPLFDTFNSDDIKNDEFVDPTESFEIDQRPVDPRLDHTVGRRGIPYLDWGINPGKIWTREVANGGPYMYVKNMFKKSEKGNFSTTTGWATGVNANNYRAYRLAHVYLWRAEVAAQQNDLATALKYVNMVRQRAADSKLMGKGTQVIGSDGKVSGYTIDMSQPAANYNVGLYPAFTSKDQALKAIQWEIRLEFGMEGLRFFDLVRWGIAAPTLNAYVAKEKTLRLYLKDANFTAGKNEYWPLPQVQLDLENKNGEILKQNPGY